MPIQIGAKPQADFGDPMGLLTDCHRRIERFLGVLQKSTQLDQTRPLVSPEREIVENALRYFSTSAPRHTQDEEESLFPRLRRSDSPSVQEALNRIAVLEIEHNEADLLHAEVDRLFRVWLGQSALTEGQSQSLSQALDRLGELYEGHIAIEEAAVFPCASAVLKADEKASMGNEMALRRGLQPAYIQK